MKRYILLIVTLLFVVGTLCSCAKMEDTSYLTEELNNQIEERIADLKGQLSDIAESAAEEYVPQLEKELTENKKWVTEEEILDYFAIGQCTPGIIAVNTATFVGKKLNLPHDVAVLQNVFLGIELLHIRIFGVDAGVVCKKFFASSVNGFFKRCVHGHHDSPFELMRFQGKG